MGSTSNADRAFIRISDLCRDAETELKNISAVLYEGRMSLSVFNFFGRVDRLSEQITSQIDELQLSYTLDPLRMLDVMGSLFDAVSVFIENVDVWHSTNPNRKRSEEAEMIFIACDNILKPCVDAVHKAGRYNLNGKPLPKEAVPRLLKPLAAALKFIPIWANVLERNKDIASTPLQESQMTPGVMQNMLGEAVREHGLFIYLSCDTFNRYNCPDERANREVKDLMNRVIPERVILQAMKSCTWMFSTLLDSKCSCCNGRRHDLVESGHVFFYAEALGALLDPYLLTAKISDLVSALFSFPGFAPAFVAVLEKLTVAAPGSWESQQLPRRYNSLLTIIMAITKFQLASQVWKKEWRNNLDELADEATMHRLLAASEVYRQYSMQTTIQPIMSTRAAAAAFYLACFTGQLLVGKAMTKLELMKRQYGNLSDEQEAECAMSIGMFWEVSIAFGESWTSTRNILLARGPSDEEGRDWLDALASTSCGLLDTFKDAMLACGMVLHRKQGEPDEMTGLLIRICERLATLASLLVTEVPALGWLPNFSAFITRLASYLFRCGISIETVAAPLKHHGETASYYKTLDGVWTEACGAAHASLVAAKVLLASPLREWQLEAPGQTMKGPELECSFFVTVLFCVNTAVSLLTPYLLQSIESGRPANDNIVRQLTGAVLEVIDSTAHTASKKGFSAAANSLDDDFDAVLLSVGTFIAQSSQVLKAHRFVGSEEGIASLIPVFKAAAQRQQEVRFMRTELESLKSLVSKLQASPLTPGQLASRALSLATLPCSNTRCSTSRPFGAGKTPGKLCSGCKTARYCCVECQKKEWKEHKVVCKSLAERQR